MVNEQQGHLHLTSQVEMELKRELSELKNQSKKSEEQFKIQLKQKDRQLQEKEEENIRLALQLEQKHKQLQKKEDEERKIFTLFKKHLNKGKNTHNFMLVWVNNYR